jgi:hypothetical protein
MCGSSPSATSAAGHHGEGGARHAAATGAGRKVVTSVDGDDLEQTTGRAIYAIAGSARSGSPRATSSWSCAVPVARHFSSSAGLGDVDRSAVQRQMIRRTIKEHLDKEKRLRPQGHQGAQPVLHRRRGAYRRSTTRREPVKGEYARIFEEEYRRFANHPDYQTCSRKWTHPRRRRGARRLLLDRQEGRLDRHREGNQTAATRRARPTT